MKLANEVLQGDSERLSKKTLQFLKAEIGSRRRRNAVHDQKARAARKQTAADERLGQWAESKHSVSAARD